MANAFSLGAAGISALGSIAGALGSNALSSFQMKEMAKYQAALNYKYAKKSALNSPSWNRQGLVKADYNPMLALANMSGANSSWTTPANPTTPDLSNVGSNAIDKMLSVQQQDNNNKLAESQVSVNNADSVLKNNQAMTELYSQLEKLNHADLLQAQKMLTDKNVSWYDKQQAREDLRVANEIERTGNDFKVGMAQAVASQISANASVMNANSNAQDVKNRYDLGINTRSDNSSIHGPFGIGVSSGSNGYKPNKSENARFKPYYRTETLKNGKKIRVKVYK